MSENDDPWAAAWTAGYRRALADVVDAAPPHVAPTVAALARQRRTELEHAIATTHERPETKPQ